MEGTAHPPEIPALRDGAPAPGIALEPLAPPVDQDENPETPERLACSCAHELPHIEDDLPAILVEASQAQLHEHFFSEYEPVGPTELTLVKMLARHAAGAELWELGGGAVGRQTARHLPQLLLGTGSGGEFRGISTGALADDVLLAGTLVNEAVDRCERHTLRRSRTFLRTLDTLTALQTARRQQDPTGGTMPPPGFADEAACEQYLYARLAKGLVPCPKCGATAGWMLPSRKRRECRDCQLQVGLRSNTVMARSPVSLRQWFDAIRRILWNPTIGAAELGAQLGVPRVATARTMRKRIRAALTSEHSSELLAGLDRHFGASAST